jgi:hypothetical protein
MECPLDSDKVNQKGCVVFNCAFCYAGTIYIKKPIVFYILYGCCVCERCYSIGNIFSYRRVDSSQHGQYSSTMMRESILRMGICFVSFLHTLQ